jgi:hypothetical protein
MLMAAAYSREGIAFRRVHTRKGTEQMAEIKKV